MADHLLRLAYFTVIGWAVRCLTGRDGGLLHYAFIGGELHIVPDDLRSWEEKELNHER